jgi:agmatinase
MFALDSATGDADLVDEELRIGNLFGGAGGGGFFDIPVVAPLDVEGADIVVIGAPTATPYASVGAYCSDGPRAIRDAVGWPGMGDHHDFDLDGTLLNGAYAVDWGDLETSETDFAGNRERLRTHTSAVLEAGAVPLILGGDDSIPIPCLAAFEGRGPITILQLDAHIDWRDEVQGERLGLSSNMRRASEMSWVDNIVQVGARGSGSARPADVADAVSWGVDLFPMRCIRSHGMHQVIDSIGKGTDVYIALDIDVMDPSIVPGVIGPAPGGFHYGEVVDLFEAVANRCRIVGFNLAEFAPSADVGNRGALAAARIAATAMGLIARQRSGS